MFSHFTAVSQNNETAAMLVSQTNPVGVELFSYANAFFCSNKFAYMLATRAKPHYKLTSIMKERSEMSSSIPKLAFLGKISTSFTLCSKQQRCTAIWQHPKFNQSSQNADGNILHTQHDRLFCFSLLKNFT